MNRKTALQVALLLWSAWLAGRAAATSFPLGRKLLQRTVSVEASRDGRYSFQAQTTAQVQRTTDAETGSKTTTVTVARSTGLAINSLRCLFTSCTSASTQVTTAVGDASADASAAASGTKLSATRTRTTTAQISRSGKNVAGAFSTADSTSLQTGGTDSGATSAASGWTAAGSASTSPSNDGKTDNNVRGNGFVRVPRRTTSAP
ncbi:hypothetical protein D9Q98_005709 [Chlorella vulgaris]|uniref:Uncharacterized protein n=1 Tax=Chlorella vulgaris TaxID=3077 RepID=A0A9D4YW82_CHLVU|nr:hypothetical protein D9Q98_005709 [Chlorella vulgaris]